MKHSKRLNSYFQNHINLNPYRKEQQLIKANSVLSCLLKNPELSKDYIIHSYQGSYALNTTIKPSPKVKKYDIDILLLIGEGATYPISQQVDLLYFILSQNGIYKEKLIRGTRCLTVNYSDDLHIDIVPCLRKEALFGNEYYIYNRKETICEVTSPFDFQKWVLSRAGSITNHQMVPVIKFFKHLRDVKQTFSAKSVLLTTLLCTQVSIFDRIDYGQFSDTATAIKTIVSRLADWLENIDKVPRVKNPVLPDEDFNRHWDQNKFNNFKSMIGLYNEWIKDAYSERNLHRSVSKWQKILGVEF